MNKKFIIEYWQKDILGEYEVPTREEAEIKQAELAEEGFGTKITEVRE